jgi:DNA-binding transcriptional LysR family regulator
MRRNDLRGTQLIREPLQALLPPGHSLAGDDEIPLSALASEPFVGMNPGYGLRELMDMACRVAGFTPRVIVASTQLGTVHGMVAAGLGVSVLPRLAAGEESIAVRLADRSVCRELGVVWRSGSALDPPTQAFLALLLEQASRHSKQDDEATG